MFLRDRIVGADRVGAVFEHAPCGLFSTDRQGLIQSVNATLATWLETPAQDIVGRLRFPDLLTHAGRIYAETHLMPMLAVRGSFQEVALVLRSPSAFERHVLISAQLIGAADEPGASVSFAVFPAEHRRAYDRELDAMRAQAQTRASWLRQVETMAGVGAWVLDVDEGKVTWSDQIYRLHDLPVGDGPSLEAALSFYPGDARGLVAHHVTRAVQTGEPFQFETELMTALGRRRRVRARGEAEWEAGRVRRVAGVFEDITERHEVETRLWRSAHVDELTGLANRTWFRRRLDEQVEAAGRDGGRFALLLLDLDGFKEVNDTLGHQAGDEVLRVAAERLGDCASGEAFLARLGGDEFALLLDVGQAPPTFAPLAERVQDAIREPVPVLGTRVFVSASVGAACFPQHAASAETLLRSADLALYEVKRSRRGTFGVFTQSLQSSLEAKKRAVDRVREAAMAQRLIVHYQPKVRLADSTLKGYEALVRLVDSDGSVSSPAAFAPAFENAECARLIDDTVLETVLRDLAEDGPLGRGAGQVSINVSDHSLQRCDYVERLLRRLEDTGTPPSLIQLEVLESVLLGRFAERLGPMLKELRDAGVEIALDDFGTGFASLAHLRDLPSDWIKLDRSFVADIDRGGSGARVLRPIVDLAHALGIQVVAEGIETETAAAYLRSIGCDEGQGWLFGRPQPAGQLLLARSGARLAPDP